MEITVLFCGANLCRHGQVIVNDDTQIPDMLRRIDPCPYNRKQACRALPSHLDELSHIISIFDGLSLRRLLNI